MGPKRGPLFSVDFNGLCDKLRGAEVERGQVYAMPRINVWFRPNIKVYAILAGVSHRLEHWFVH